MLLPPLLPLLLVGPALATTPPLDTWRPDAEAYTPSMDPLTIGPLGQAAVGLSVDRGERPWVVGDLGGIEARWATNLSMGVHLGRGLRWEAQVPVVVATEGVDPQDGGPLSSPAVGSVRTRLRIAGRFADVLRLSAGVRAELPSFELGATTDPPRVGPELALAITDGPAWFGLSAGAASRELDTRAGFALRAGQLGWVGLEALGTGRYESGGELVNLGLEGRAGVHVRASSLLSFAGGAGYGLVPADGVPGLRLWAGLDVAWGADRAPARSRAEPARSSGDAHSSGDARSTEGARRAERDPAPAPAPAPTPAPSAPPVLTVAAPPAAPPPVAAPVSGPAETSLPTVTLTRVDPFGVATRTTGPMPARMQLVLPGEADHLAPAAVGNVDALAQVLLASPGTRVRLELHIGPQKANVDEFQRSQARGEALRQALLERGVPPAAIAEVVGFGAEVYLRDVVDVVVIPADAEPLLPGTVPVAPEDPPAP